MNYINTMKSFVVAGLVALIVAQTPGAHAAGTASLTMSPSTSTEIGNTVSVTIYENGTDVNVVTASVTYDASKLTCTGVDVSGSAFANGVSASCAGGSAVISRYVTPGTPGLSGSVIVGMINFKATATGPAVLSFIGSSQIASAGVNTWNGVTGGTTVTVNAVPVAVPVAEPVAVPVAAVSIPSTSTTTNTTARSVSVPPVSKKNTVAVATTNATAQPETTTSTIAEVTPQVLDASTNPTTPKTIATTTTPIAKAKGNNHIAFISILVLMAASAVLYYTIIKRKTDKKSVINYKK